MIRVGLSILFSAGVLTLGLWTSFQAAANRQRGDKLDRAQRWCEAQSRRNDVQRAHNARLEWLLIQGQEGVWLDAEYEGGDS